MNREAISLKYSRDGEKLRLSERILLAICRPTKAPPLSVATHQYTLENALNYSRLMVPDFPARVRGKSVLDYGCGPGWQAVAMQLLAMRRAEYIVDYAPGQRVLGPLKHLDLGPLNIAVQHVQPVQLETLD
jgi:hypothetical protein